MEKMMHQFQRIYQGKRVLVTGNTGFKGSWLSYWLLLLKADVHGYSLRPSTNPSHFELLNLPYPTYFDDIRDYEKLTKALKAVQPDIIFHLAAQPLVRYSYLHPQETIETNILGTANVLEASRAVKSIKALILITSDKCYENNEWVWGYRENDRLGGTDPYSSSKACAEIIIHSYVESFFSPRAGKNGARALVASARAGNVIGGGDWSPDRIVPDIVQGAARNDVALLRNPLATRPWQHVLEPLSGYLQLGQKLLEGDRDFIGAWNFGPSDDDVLTVEEMVREMKRRWKQIRYKIRPNADYHESRLLKLDCSKAQLHLKWRAAWETSKTIAKTVEWYRQFYTRPNADVRKMTLENIREYVLNAANKNIHWSK
jgi:CDP-glucose 4,6-dehydratase